MLCPVGLIHTACLAEATIGQTILQATDTAEANEGFIFGGVANHAKERIGYAALITFIQ